MNVRFIFLFIISASLGSAAQSDSLRLTLSEAIALAQRQSSDALAARHALEAAEWSYKNYRANYLPAVTLSSSPSLNRQISSITQPDGTNVFVRQNQLNTDLSLSISQNVALTGGTLFLRNDLQRLDEFEQHTHDYSSVPFSIGYQQNLFASPL